MAITKVNNDLQDALAAAQPTITSTGTLTNLTVSGEITANGGIGVTGNITQTGANSADFLIKAPTDNASLTLQAGSSDAGAEGAFVSFLQNTTYKWQMGMNTDNSFRWYNYATSSEAMKIDSAGYIQMGSPLATHIGTSQLFVNRGVNAAAATSGTTQTGGALRLRGANNAVLDMGLNGTNTWIQATDRANLANGYNLSLNPNGGDVGIGLPNGNHRFQVFNNKGNMVCAKFESNSVASQEYGLAVILANDPNGTTRYIFAGIGGSTVRFIIYANGNVKNQNNSYTGISDEKLKENISDATSQWEDIKAIRVRKYSFKEENATSATQIGVIAQEVVAAGMSGLVYETPDQVTAEDGTIENTGEVTKNMKYSILYMKAVKALQEAMTRIETLERRLTALEGE